MMPSFLLAILIINLVATITMFGIIWFVQIVHYPLFAEVGKELFSNYEQKHQQLTTYVVVPPMLLELATSLLLAVTTLEHIKPWLPIVGLALTIAIWLSTFFIQVPLHTQLAVKFDKKLHSKLVRSNWLRTVMWSMRVPIAVWMLMQFCIS